MSGEARLRLADRIAVAQGRLTLRTGKVDIGQRIGTALARIAAEETTLPLDLIDVAPVATGSAPDEGITSGSNSVERSGAAIRAAAATAREAALRRAAAALGADRVALRLADGLVAPEGSNRSLRLLDLIAELPPDLPIDPDAPSRPGRPLPPAPPRGMADMARGAFRYVHDLRAPGMLHARAVRPPHAAARLATLDARTVAALEAEGALVARDGSFLAVAAPVEWAALRAARRLARACGWDRGAGLEEGDVFEMLETRPRISMPIVDGRPVAAPVPPPLAAPTHSARFQRPYALHGSLAPSAAFAEWRGGRLRVICSSQGVYALRESMAEALDLDPDAVEVAFAPGSGCYGHNGADDAAFEAALVAMAAPDTPILLKWTREEEHAWEPVGPAATVRLAARLEGGRVAAFSAEAFSDTHRGRPRPGPDGAGPARLLASRFRAIPRAPWRGAPNMNRHGGLHRNLEPVYAFPETRLVKNLVPGLPLRSSALRTLGATVNIFAIESFMDELAEAAAADPIALRLAHLPDIRARETLERLAAALERHGPAPPEGGRGVAFAQYKNAQARVAAAADIVVSDQGDAVARRLTLVVDAGRVVDPDGLVAQIEGGAIQALGWALSERVAWDRDGVLTRDWEASRPLRFEAIPEIVVETIDRRDAPSLGAGEAACGPVVAAVANAVADATGLRPRRMPFDRDALLDLAHEA